MNRAIENNCSGVMALLDRYMDQELSGEEWALVERHLNDCPGCASIAARRSALRNRLRSAARDVGSPLGLDQRIRQRLAEQTTGRNYSRVNHGGGWMAAAAALLLTVSLGVYWRNGGLRFTPQAQDAYIASIAPEVAPVMRIGLQQHVHCAVFKGIPSQWPTLEEMAQSLGAEYADLAPAVQRHLPSGFRVAEAHVCSYRGRYYTHVAATDGKKLISLLITNRSQGEAFETELRAVAGEAGVPLYISAVQRFSLAGFETRGHLVYLVSDLDYTRNLAVLKSLAPDVDKTVRRFEIS